MDHDKGREHSVKGPPVAEETRGIATAWMRRWGAWLLLGGPAVVVFALGMWGNHLCMPEPHTIADLVYATARMFILEDSAPQGPKPWQVEAARFLAPLVSFSALVVAGLSFIKGSFRLLWLDDHVIICGIGPMGLHLVRHYSRKGDKVVVVEREADHEGLEVCKDLGAVVVHGDASDESTLRRARCARARAMVVVCGDDAVNVATALCARSIARDHRPAGVRDALKLFLHIGDFRWCVSFRHLEAFTDIADRFDVIPFNFYENCARAALESFPLDVDPATGECIRADDPRRIHVVVMGFGQMGEAVALQAASVAHAANLSRPSMTIVDSKEGKESSFRARYPRIDGAVDISFREANIDDPEVRGYIAKLAADPDVMLTLAFCVKHETRVLSWALNLPPEVRENSVRILVRLPEDRFRELVKDKVQLMPFGDIPEGCDLREERDELARAIHEDYRQGGSDIPPWEQLDEGLKGSNRQQADHIPLKLRAVGCEMVALSEAGEGGSSGSGGGLISGFSFTDQEVELLAGMEHARWCAERFLSGWRPGPKDRERKVSPYLVPYDRLDEEIKEYDRKAVRAIPSLLRSKLGAAVRRKTA